jgi:hypothetical protein
MRVRELRLTNFRAFGQQASQLTYFYCRCGVNGGGKTVMDALFFCFLRLLLLISPAKRLPNDGADRGPRDASMSGPA